MSRKSASPSNTDHSIDWGRWSILCGMAALFVARPLVPSESAPQGEGLLFVTLWLLLLVAWSAIGWRERRLPIYFNRIDACVFALVGWFVVAAIWAVFQSGPARPTINLLWEWVGLATSYFLARQLLRSATAINTMLLGMGALAFALACYGTYQYAVEIPALQQQFASNPQSLLQASGLDQDIAALASLEQRINSSEPYGTFALANSLAGFLAPWLVLLIGFGFRIWQDQPRSLRCLFAVAVMMTIISICLTLTKSRTAHLAVAAGLMLVLIQLRMFAWRVWASLALVITLLAGVAFAVGAVDREVLTEAGKSLAYRVQYWQGASDIIADHPLFGCGPGRFREHYTRYKAETASEEAIDPHNFVFELAATVGLPALAFGFLLTIMFVRQLWGTKQSTQADSQREVPPTSLVVGCLLGPLLAALIGLSVQYPQIFNMLPVLVLLIGLGLWGFWPWVANNRISISLYVVALVALAINLLAAGGLNIPGVIGSGWLLLAIIVNSTEISQAEPSPRCDSISPLAPLGISLVLVLAAYWTAYQPVSYAQLFLQRSKEASQQERESYLLQAAAADPLASEPTLELASFSLGKWLQSKRADDWREFEHRKDEYLQRRGRCDVSWSQIALWYREAFAAEPNPHFAQQEVLALRRAVEWYPNSAVRWAELALAHQRAKELTAAREAAKEALRLSAVTPHADKQLSHELQEQLQRIQ